MGSQSQVECSRSGTLCSTSALLGTHPRVHGVTGPVTVAHNTNGGLPYRRVGVNEGQVGSASPTRTTSGSRFRLLDRIHFGAKHRLRSITTTRDTSTDTRFVAATAAYSASAVPLAPRRIHVAPFCPHACAREYCTHGPGSCCRGCVSDSGADTANAPDAGEDCSSATAPTQHVRPHSLSFPARSDPNEHTLERAPAHRTSHCSAPSVDESSTCAISAASIWSTATAAPRLSG